MNRIETILRGKGYEEDLIQRYIADFIATGIGNLERITREELIQDFHAWMDLNAGNDEV